MKWMYIGAMTMLLGSAIAIQAASPSTTSSSVNAPANVDQSKRAARLLRDISADGMAITSVAARMDSLAQNGNAKWTDYDRHWNEIAPSVEDMRMKLGRLEAMESSLSPAERMELDQCKPLIGEIQSRTRQFNTLLNTPGVQTSDTRFKTYSRSLRNEAGKLEKLTPAT
jgi:hypothetical protein